MKELKRVSNLWLKEHGRDYANFDWQGGYTDFSVSQSNLKQVIQYIAGQEEHHRKVGFQDELRADGFGVGADMQKFVSAKF